MTSERQGRRAVLLDELESIRTLLGEEAHGNNDLELLVKAGKIPLLLPEQNSGADNIPTLQPECRADRHIPVLSMMADTASTIPAAASVITSEPDPLEAMRQAAAKVAAARQRDSIPAAAPSERAQLVEDVVRAALPRVEILLRELVQEVLLQDKLRGGKR